MKRRTKVRIQRTLFLAKLFGGTAGFIFLLFRFETFRHLVCLFAVACILTALLEYAEYKAAKEREAEMEDICNDGYPDR